MARLSPLLLLALACALFDVSLAWNEVPLYAGQGSQREMTNAERLAKGLPPKKPQFNRRAGDGRLKPSLGFTTITVPTPSISIVVPTPTFVSDVACPQVSGTIKVSSKDGSLAGFVSAPNEEGLYGYTTNAADAAKFKFNTCSSPPFDISGEVTDIENAAFELLGGVQDARSGCFLVGNVPQTSQLQNLPNPLASILGLASSQVSSTIWELSSGSLLAHLGDTTANTGTPITYNPGTGLFAFNQDGKCPGTDATFTFVQA